MDLDIPIDRPLHESELAVAVARAIIDDQQNPGLNNPFQTHSLGLIARLGWPPRGNNQQDLRNRFLQQNRDLDSRIQEYCWRLVGLGFLVPANSVESFRPTTRGRVFLEGFDPTALTAGQMEARVAALGFGTDDPARQYTRLAQDCFLAGHHESAVVMLGAAAEALVQPLVDLLSSQRQSLGLSVSPVNTRATAAQKLKWLQNVVTNHETELRRAMEARSASSGWIDGLQSNLATGQAIRQTRNDLGHPQGFSMDHAGALQLLTLFPRFADACVGAMNALGSPEELVDNS